MCYLFSFLNPQHELRTREIITEMAPDLHVSLSHEVLPRVREFERLSTTLVDAFVTPGLRYYLHRLGDTLREEQFSGDLFAMAANGGMVSIDLASRHGVQLVLSGPAGGIVASVDEGRANGVEDLITVDMGGTSFDVCLVKKGEPDISTEEWINRYQVAIPTLDIQTFGAGGGSIAWVDEGRKLRVGPQSAGADPGPACYGRGGELPTVTDADLYLGLMGAKSFLGGSLSLDVQASEDAIREHVAEPLGIEVEEAATGILKVVNTNMANGIAEVTMKRGYDPRDLTIVAFGGAGPCTRDDWPSTYPSTGYWSRGAWHRCSRRSAARAPTSGYPKQEACMHAAQTSARRRSHGSTRCCARPIRRRSANSRTCLRWRPRGSTSPSRCITRYRPTRS